MNSNALFLTYNVQLDFRYLFIFDDLIDFFLILHLGQINL